ncbi:MAG: FHA domain-containing protein, partial [Bdellovibrionaceae bacterium]|nr:FHA domain-containing protein [Pseudobdellovibrionaceae bacterium]
MTATKSAQLCQVRIVPHLKKSHGAELQHPELLTYVDRDCFVIGNSPEADVQLSGSGVIGHHLLIKIQGTNIVLEDLGSPYGTTVNGQAVTSSPFTYTHGQEIQLGQSDHLVTLELFAPLRTPEEQAHSILQEAQARAAEFDKRARALQQQCERKLAETQASIASMEAAAKAEIEKRLAAAQRAIEEKNRKAIEDRHFITENFQREAQADAQSLIDQRKEEGDQILARAKTVADELIMSAREEVNRMLDEAHLKVEAVHREGLLQHESRLKQVSGMEEQIATLHRDLDRMQTETARAREICEEAIQKKQMLVRQTEQLEAQSLEKQAQITTREAELQEQLAGVENK